MNAQTIHSCIIAVSESGDAILISSEPSLIDSNIFDGSFLDDNLTKMESKPTEIGVYRCVIKCEHSSFFDHYGGGTEYDAEIWIEEVEKIETGL